MAKKQPVSKTTPRRLGAAKVVTKAGTVWCHLSVLGDTFVLRRYSEGMIFVVEAEREEIEDFVPLEDCRELVKADKFGYKRVAVWTKILQKLEAGKPDSKNVSTKKPAAQKTIVPITELRRIYDVLKLLDVPTYQNLAQFYSETPTSLKRLWDNSRTTFDKYKNSAGWGKGKREDLPDAPKSLIDVNSTDEFTAFLIKNPIDNYSFVERELNPWSTKLGMFSNKLPATKSGRGGMDLLLCLEGVPVVGEVKVKKDKNAFYALIQAMTYAVELSTENQLKRLKSQQEFQNAFGTLDPKKTDIGIALILVKHPSTDQTFAPVCHVVKEINRSNEFDGLGRIAILRNDENGVWKDHALPNEPN